MSRKHEDSQKRKAEKGPCEAAAQETAVEVTDPVAVEGFPIVGIGASAGGLAAFESFFSGMPEDVDPGMAFVLIQHLAPDHKSILTELIRRFTRMQVFEVEDGMVVRPNCAYIIPPNHDMAFLHGTLQLLQPTEPRGQRLPIDFFFRSLAQDQRERAIGIILSGTGSDGTLGVRAIKGEGGMVMVQKPESTEFDGMPLSAIATGLVDYELLPEEMPGQLMAYASHAFIQLPEVAPVHEPKTENAMRKIFILLRAQTGHEFSQYKPGTIYRRIERRKAVHEIEDIEDYVKFLQDNPAEVEALFRDLLIGVTSFFRDPETFIVLEDQVIPKLFASKPAGGVVRVWSAGCSTGEEAYSIAILLQECMEARKQSYTVQVFATDIDRRAIATARMGLYPASIAADISAERLARFFTAEPDGSAYRIHKGIRDMLVFSEQNVIKDPPFSKLDLISCRNLMIYLGLELQKKLIPMFHYALNPNGILFLGTSEGVGEFSDLFAVVDRKAKIYQRKEDFHVARRPGLSRFLPPMTAIEAALPRLPHKTAFPVKLPLRELTEQALLREFSPAAVLVNSHGDILYQHGRTGMFLELAPGETGVSNIISMAREGLRPGLSTALHRAAASREAVKSLGLNVRTNGHFSVVNVSIQPVPATMLTPPESLLFLVVLEEVRPTDAPPAEVDVSLPAATDAEARIAALKQELRAKDEYLQSTHEELESSTEELKSSNEEMQSVNEELQSTNEELETSKEELQSVNEELATVNTELQTKVSDLSRANNDMNNLLAGTGIGTVFVDHQLRILRFTPAASAITNMILSDVGRPVAHIVSNLVGYDNLVDDVRSVLNTLVPKEVDVQTRENKWYTLRILPYRTLDNVIEGAVMTFVEITEMLRTRDALRRANDELRLAAVVRDSNEAIVVQDLQGHILAWNPCAAKVYGWTEAEALAMNLRDRVPPEIREEALATVIELGKSEHLTPHDTLRLHKNGGIIHVTLVCSALLDEAGRMYAIATTERNESSVATPQLFMDTVPPHDSNDASSSADAKLRQRAETAFLRKAAFDPSLTQPQSPEEMQRALHDLHVYQIELEMQNEELRRAQAEVEIGRTRYFDLYDLAPVGYITLSEAGMILESNYAAAALLGVSRRRLVKQVINRFVFPGDQDVWYLQCQRLLETGHPQVTELRMLGRHNQQFWARLEATIVRHDSAPCRVPHHSEQHLRAQTGGGSLEGLVGIFLKPADLHAGWIFRARHEGSPRGCEPRLVPDDRFLSKGTHRCRTAASLLAAGGARADSRSPDGDDAGSRRHV